MEQQCVSNIALINIKRAYANSAVNNDIYHTVGQNWQRQICFLTCFTSLYDQAYIRIYSIHM